MDKVQKFVLTESKKRFGVGKKITLASKGRVLELFQTPTGQLKDVSGTVIFISEKEAESQGWIVDASYVQI